MRKCFMMTKEQILRIVHHVHRPKANTNHTHTNTMHMYFVSSAKTETFNTKKTSNNTKRKKLST